jgi:2-desacetyl-2-hydroxyethyl bacteriochlorophyllide A dehydrogenase
MKAIVNTGPGRMELLELPTPEPAAGQVRIRTAACGICATDLEMIAGWERTKFPAVPGHEWSGFVDAVGSGVDGSLVGKQCVAENVLADGGEVGFEHPGGYGQFLITEARNLQVFNHKFEPDTAALVEPTAVCVRGMRRLRPSPDDKRALIFGDGPIGLISLMLLRRAGVPDVYVVGGRDARLALATKLGATGTMNYHSAGGRLAEEIKARFGHAFPLQIEGSGSDAAMAAAIDLAAREGRVLAVGAYGERVGKLPLSRLQIGEIEIIGTNASAGAWGEATRLVTAGELPLSRLITHRAAVKDYAKAFDLMHKDPGLVKLVLEWDPRN